MATDVDARVDVLVIGAGGCGLVAALAADRLGASVAIVEKAPVCQGNTALSSGSIPAAGTRLQRAAGVVDTAETFARDLAMVAGPHDASHLVGVLAAVSAELIDFLIDDTGLELDLVTKYKHVGHGIHRLHAPPSRRGADLIGGLERAVAQRDIPLAFSQPATALIDDGARVCGAVVGTPAAPSRIGADAVILACNGFAARADLLAHHCPGATGAIYAGSPHSAGEALEWGLALDAGTGNLGAYQGHAAISVETGALMTWTLVERGAIVVDGRGRRFGDETLGYSAFADLELAGTGPFHLVYDARIAEDVAAGQPDFAAACAMGVARSAGSPGEIEVATGLPAGALAKTLAAARAAARGEAPDAFGRLAWGFGPLGAALRYSAIQPACFHTQGGLMVNGQAEVIRKDGTAIPGLYAGGGAAVGISGRRGGAGYMSGNGLLSALGLGFIAGRAAASRLVSPSAPPRLAGRYDVSNQPIHNGG